MKLGNSLYFLLIPVFLNASTLFCSFTERVTLPKNLIYINGKFLDSANNEVVLSPSNVAIVWDFDETLASHDENEFNLFCQHYKKELATIIKVSYGLVPPRTDDEIVLFKAIKAASLLPTISAKIMLYAEQGLPNFAQCLIDMYCVRTPTPGIGEILSLLENRGYSHFLATNQGPLLFDAIYNKRAFSQIFRYVSSGLISSTEGNDSQNVSFNASKFKKPTQDYFNDFQNLLDPTRKYTYFILIDDTVRNFKMFSQMDNFIGIKFENAEILLQDLKEMNVV